MGKNVTVYTMDYCPYCESAKKLLKAKGIAYKEVKLDMDDDAAWEELEKKTNYKTMPQIFIDERFIGEYNDLATLDKKGELDQMVK